MNLVPLTMNMEGCATQEEMNANVSASIERGYVRINEFLGTKSGKVSIVGAGPSLATTYKDLEGDVLAINSAVGFLVDHGVTPTYGMVWDASPLVRNFIRRGFPWLVGARCHPGVFEELEGEDVIVWHAGGDHNIKAFLSERQIQEPMINGGSAGVTRALYLAFALGYTDIHLYGADSSCLDGETHVKGSLVTENFLRIWLRNDDHKKLYMTTPEMCAQVEEFKMIYAHFTSMGIPIEVHGEGLLPTIWKRLKADLDFQQGKISEAECSEALAA